MVFFFNLLGLTFFNLSSNIRAVKSFKTCWQNAYYPVWIVMKVAGFRRKPDFLNEGPAIFFITRTMYPQNRGKIMEKRRLILERLELYKENWVQQEPYQPINNRNRRCSTGDRRRSFTFLANDKRSGIADRRKKTPSIEAWFEYWRQAKLKKSKER